MAREEIGHTNFLEKSKWYIPTVGMMIKITWIFLLRHMYSDNEIVP
jgi:hypothetical protein